jgi:hypothetical protein
VFETRKLLNRHTRSLHKDGKRIKCDGCDKSFRDNYGLRRHLEERQKSCAVETTFNEENENNKENEAPAGCKRSETVQSLPSVPESS